MEFERLGRLVSCGSPLQVIDAFADFAVLGPLPARGALARILVGEVRLPFSADFLRFRGCRLNFLPLALPNLHKMMNVAGRDSQVTFVGEYLRYAPVRPVSITQLVNQLGVRIKARARRSRRQAIEDGFEFLFHNTQYNSSSLYAALNKLRTNLEQALDNIEHRRRRCAKL